MMLFYVGSALLLLLAAAFIVWPLYFKREIMQPAYISDQRQSTNVQLYQDHLNDLDKSLSSNNINQAQYTQLKTELERNLLEDSQEYRQQDNVAVATAPQVSGRLLLVALAFVLLVFTSVAYSKLGAYRSVELNAALERRSALEEQYFTTRDESLKTSIAAANHNLVIQISAHLARNPEDVQMTVLLARTYMSMGMGGKAIELYQQAIAMEPGLSQIMAELAQAIFLQANNRIVPIVEKLVADTLAIDPSNTVALGLAGIASFQNERYQEAIDYWEQSIFIQGVNSANYDALQAGIAAARSRLEAQPASDNIAINVEPVEGADVQNGLVVNVSLGDKVDFSPDDVVFIYARAWQGSRMPLSVAKVAVGELPATLTLTNEMSMTPEMNLESADQLELVARLSKDGGPIPKSGDWEVTMGPLTLPHVDDVTHNLVISSQIQ